MDTQPFQSLAPYLRANPWQKWGAVAAALGATLAVLLLAPVAYLYIDLIDSRGRLPDWNSQPAAIRQSFRSDWDAHLKEDPAVKSALDKLPNGRVPAEMAQWWAVQEAGLRKHVSDAAADRIAYVHTDGTIYPGTEPVGILATVARHRGTLTGSLLSWFVSWNSWTWENESYLLGLFVLAFVLVLSRGLLLTLNSVLASGVAVEAAVRLRRGVYNHSLRLGALAVNPEAQIEAGDIISRRCEQVMDGSITRLTTHLRAPTLAIGCLILVLAIHLWIALAGLFLGAAIWLMAGQSAAWFRRDARQAARRTDSRLALLRENMSLMQLVKAYLMERFNQTRVERHLTELARAARRRLRGETLSRPALTSVTVATGLILTLIASRVILSGGISLAAATTQALLLGTLAVAVNRWIASHVRLRRDFEAAAIVAEFLDRRADAAQAIDAEFLQPLSRKLEIVELSFREPGTGRMILDGVSMNLHVGTRVAVVCSTPSEARSLAHLIARFHEPTGGEVRFDGKNLRWVTHDSLRTQVALVLPDTLTFSETVANNIGCGEPSFTLPQIIEAAKLAHAHQFIQRLPYGYETPLGDHGHALRPGESYRIALARAILRDPSVLLIEEPAEPLDPDSAALIDDALTRFQPNRLIVILTRRSSTIRQADKVYVIQQGKVTASGNQDQLHVGSEVHKALTQRPG